MERKIALLPGEVSRTWEDKIFEPRVDVPFEKEEELQRKSARLAELNILLNMDKHENEVLDVEPDEDMDVPEKKIMGYER